MSKYQKRDNSVNTLDEFIYKKTGLSIAALNTYKDEYAIQHLQKAADEIRDAIKDGRPIVVYGDYDADGITSLIILTLLLISLKAKVRIIAPRRFTDGYGISEASFAKKDIPDGCLLITVDNGITAVAAMRYAIEHSMRVVILDHHLAGDTIPEHHVLIDPEAIPNSAEFDGYCGAGLSFKLCELMNPKILPYAVAFAAIGTVADVVPLKEDNRRIVQAGLRSINRGTVPYGLKKVISLFGLDGHCTAEDLAFSIAPAINARGRLEDNGGTYTIKTLLSNGLNADTLAAEMIAKNNERKEIVKQLMASVSPDANDKVNFLVVDGTWPGLFGLAAGKIQEETGKPTFIMSNNNGIVSGSARSDDETKNDVSAMLRSVKDLLLGFGGHPGAAGFRFEEKNLHTIHERLSDYDVKPHEEKYLYDLDLNPIEAKAIRMQMDNAEPFGKGLEKPVYRITCHFNGDRYWNTMGKLKEHCSFSLPYGLKAVMFSRAEEYKSLGCPKDIYLYGSLEWDWLRGRKTVKFRVSDFEII